MLETSKKTWRDYPRKKDKLAIVGFAETTRHLAPYDDPEYEIWSLNEGYNNHDWLKRFDRWFQIHPRWDFTRDNNTNHRNHWNWLQNKSGTCAKCKGEGAWDIEEKGEKKTVICSECNKGIYTPPEYRANLLIYMQEQWDDIPNSIAFPLEEAKSLLPPTLNQKDYFTSSAAFMLVMAVMMGYKRIEFYGFEMGTMTEYHYQRANFEYLIGWFSKDAEIVVPAESTLLRGELYGFKNMKTGMRQNLEMRKIILESQEKVAQRKVDVHTGKVQALQSVVQGNSDFKAALEDVMREYQVLIGTHNVVKGALAEVDNMTKLYDYYFLSGSDEGSLATNAEEVQKIVNVEYQS